MNLLSLLAGLESRGLDVRADDSEIVIRPAGQLTADERAAILANRELILDLLHRRQGDYTPRQAPRLRQTYVGALYDPQAALAAALAHVEADPTLTDAQRAYLVACAEPRRSAENRALLPPLLAVPTVTSSAPRIPETRRGHRWQDVAQTRRSR